MHLKVYEENTTLDSSMTTNYGKYADDTLILLRAELEDVMHLKTLLDEFTAAIGHHINFAKSTVVPMYVDKSLLPLLISVLGCHQESFPKTYLGLLLSNEKLHLYQHSHQSSPPLIIS
jgi:hypothetical protein